MQEKRKIYRASANARWSFNTVLLHQLIWQPTLTKAERLRIDELRRENAMLERLSRNKEDGFWQAKEKGQCKN
jgi:hypothetical protein